MHEVTTKLEIKGLLVINASQRKFINDNNWMRDNVSHAKTFIYTVYVCVSVCAPCYTVQ